MIDKNCKVEFHDLDCTDDKLRFVVIQARYLDKWIFVRHKDRSTWEIPGGHIEHNESPYEAAKRELIEETGSLKFELQPICEYTVIRDDKRSSGRLYFAIVKELGELGEYEIKERLLSKELPENLTYKSIQPMLYSKIIKHLQ